MGDIQTLARTSKPTADGLTVHSAALKLTNNGAGIQAEIFVDGSTSAVCTTVDPFSGYTYDVPIVDFDTLWFEAPSDNNGFAIDNVTVKTTVPEPSSALLSMGALTFMASVLRRRKPLL
jgi:hypothetical protein